ncbi:molybdopterin dinucleotide binding domain-containing protein, partial [Ideonella sp.]|uniref:nitrate reductase n=1 Tax=Ideonella sp. TaxID=1929293 RepID=UPI002B468759
ARRLAARIAPERAALFDYPTPESVWLEHRASTRGRDLDITGLSYALLEQQGPQQWPCPSATRLGKARLYEDGIFPTADGRARFADVPFAPLAEPRDARYPFSLNTGRLRDQWHGMSRTGTLGRLYGHDSLPCIDLHPQDLQRLKLADGELVRVRSRRGQVVLPVRANDAIAPTQAFIAMHWGQEVLSGHDAQGRPLTGVNALTTPALCPQSKQPELKHAAVAIDKVTLPWRLTAMAWLPADEALALRERLKPRLALFGHASLLPFGREADARPSREVDAPAGSTGRVGLLLRAAAIEAPSDAVLAPLRAAFGLAQAGVLAYHDARRGQQRALRVSRDADGAERLQGFWVAGDTSGEAWLRTLLEADQTLPAPGRQLLAPGTFARQSAAPRSPQVCTCFNVGEAAIRAELGRCNGSPDERLEQLQGRLKCGTNCGSCLPALRKIIQVVPGAMAA